MMKLFSCMIATIVALGLVLIADASPRIDHGQSEVHVYHHMGTRGTLARLKKKVKRNIQAIRNNRSRIRNHEVRITALEEGPNNEEVSIDCATDSSSLLNTLLRPGLTYVLSGMCEGPIYIQEPAGLYRFRGDNNGTKDDGIFSPAGRTEYYVVGIYGPVSATFDNLVISAENYTSQSDGGFTAAAYIEGNASVSLFDVDILGGDSGVVSDSAYVFIGGGVNVTGFGQAGLEAARGGTILVGREINVVGAANLPGEDRDTNEALSAYRNGVIQIQRGGSFIAGTDDGSNPNFESYSVNASENGTIRFQNRGTVNLEGIVGAFRAGVIRITTGTLAGAVSSGDQSHVRFDNVIQTGGGIEVFRGSGFRADNSILSENTSDPMTAGQLSYIRLNGSVVGNTSGAASISLFNYSHLSLSNATNLGGRNVDCIDSQSFQPGDGVNIGAVSC